MELELLELELPDPLELLDPLLLDPLLPELLLFELLLELELPLLEPLELLPEPDEDCELVLLEAGGGGRNMTERTSISIRLRSARANSARSTSSCPLAE